MRRCCQHAGLAPATPAVVRQRQQHRAGRADRKAPPHRVRAQVRQQQVGQRHADAPQRERQDQQWRDHRAGGTHYAGNHEGHAEQQERPDRNVIEVARDLQRRAVAGQEQCQRPAVEQDQRCDEQAGHQEIGGHTGACGGIHARPQAGADILRGHRRAGRAERHRRHLHVVPQLQGCAIGGSGIGAEAVDQRQHRDHGQRDQHHLQSHRHAFAHQRTQDGGIDAEQRQVAPSQPQHVATAAQIQQQPRQRHRLRQHRGPGRAGDA